MCDLYGRGVSWNSGTPRRATGYAAWCYHHQVPVTPQVYRDSCRVVDWTNTNQKSRINIDNQIYQHQLLSTLPNLIALYARLVCKVQRTQLNIFCFESARNTCGANFRNFRGEKAVLIETPETLRETGKFWILPPESVKFELVFTRIPNFV